MVWSSLSWGEGVNVSKLVCSGVSASRPTVTGSGGAAVGARKDGPPGVDGAGADPAGPPGPLPIPVPTDPTVATDAGPTAGGAASTAAPGDADPTGAAGVVDR